MPWVGFPTRAAFDQVHDEYCAEHGIPRPGKRTSDDELQFDAQWTTAQFAPLVIDVLVNGNPRKIGVANVSQQTMDRYGLTEVVIVKRHEDDDGQPINVWDVEYNGNPFTVEPVTDEGLYPFRKVKPPQWTDPDTDITYDTATGEPV